MNAVIILKSKISLFIRQFIDIKRSSLYFHCLTSDQEKDYETYGYKCRLPVYFRGETTSTWNYLVRVGLRISIGRSFA
jgi:hypothetical protein